MGNNYLKDKYKTNFVHYVSKPVTIEQKDFRELTQEEFITSIEQKIQTKVVDNLDNVLLDLLYEEFNKSEVTDLIVLDKTAFKEFLLKYVPMYLEVKETPTLEEVKKEWEELGFNFCQNNLYIYLDNERYGINLVIDKNAKVYHIFTGYITIELNKLLTKTFRALGWEDV